MSQPTSARALQFAQGLGLRVPLLMAPMAGASPVALAAAVVQGGGMAGYGALLHGPAAIADWVRGFRALAGADAALQINLWVPDPQPVRDAAHEARVRAFLSGHGPEVAAEAGDALPPDFDAQMEAVIEVRPRAFSSIMGLPSPTWVQRLRQAGIAWWAVVTTLAEARAAAAAGADAIVAQGAEAGGHRGAFDAARARDESIGLLALLPQVVDAVAPVPVIATGGIADARGIAAALTLGASAVQLGTAYLHCAEAGIAPAWQSALVDNPPEATRLTRAFSGRWGRSLATGYVHAAAAPGAPEPAPYPVQRGLTAAMRKAAEAAGDVQHLQAWAGQSAALAAPWAGQSAATKTNAAWVAALALLQAG
ncbi:MAG: NAD(P)H-dependent flavin oxidoreductase [Rubrivivax sp.]|jgi:nitronate monooxygenase